MIDQGRRNRSGRPGNCRTNVLVLDKHRSGGTECPHPWIHSYVLGTRLEGKSVYESSYNAAKREVSGHISGATTANNYVPTTTCDLERGGASMDNNTSRVRQSRIVRKPDSSGSAVQSTKVLRDPIQATEK